MGYPETKINNIMRVTDAYKLNNICRDSIVHQLSLDSSPVSSLLLRKQTNKTPYFKHALDLSNAELKRKKPCCCMIVFQFNYEPDRS